MDGVGQLDLQGLGCGFGRHFGQSESHINAFIFSSIKQLSFALLGAWGGLLGEFRESLASLPHLLDVQRRFELALSLLDSFGELLGMFDFIPDLLRNFRKRLGIGRAGRNVGVLALTSSCFSLI